MKSMLRAVALLVLALLAACKPIKFASAQEEAAAQGWIAELRARHFKAIENVLDPSLPGDDREAILATMADAIPAGTPASVKLVGDEHVTSTAGHVVNLTYEYEFSGRWLLVNVAVKTRDGATTLIGLNVTPIPEPLEVQNRFSLADRPAICWIVLGLAIVSVLLTVLALVVCARTRLRGRKWPWIVAILFGVGTVTVNWTTGQWQLTPLALLMFGAAAMSANFGPWMISAGLPVGAAVFLVRRLSLTAPPAAPEPEAAVTPE